MNEKVKAAKKTADGAPDATARGLLPPFGRGAEIIETHSRARLDTDDFGRCVLRSVRDAVFFEATGFPIGVAYRTSSRHTALRKKSLFVFFYQSDAALRSLRHAHFRLGRLGARCGRQCALLLLRVPLAGGDA